MTRVIHDFGESMQKEATNMVSLDVNFPKGRFPDYKIGANNTIIEPEEAPKSTPLKEIVAKETAQLLQQQKRLSVRDLKEKFEKGLTGAAKLSEEAKKREAASLDRQVLLKKLRDVLDSLRGRVAGRNRDETEEAISLVEALAVQLTQREGELIHEKAELKKLANFLKQATEDAKKVVEEERALAIAEIEKAKSAIERVEKAWFERETVTDDKDQQELEELRNEVREARRIKMLHQPSKVMDMEFELQALRSLVLEKSQLCAQLKKELAMIKKLEDANSTILKLQGNEVLGSILKIVCQADAAPDISICLVQWYRVPPAGTNRELIHGATKTMYAPEPFDVGNFLKAEIIVSSEKVEVATAGPINPAAGLENYVESLYKLSDAEFTVSVIQMNGQDFTSKSVHIFHVGRLRVKLRKGRSTKAKESYSNSMKLCGSRGGGNAAAKAVFWQASSQSFTLAFQTERDRNAALMLARKFASDCNVALVGPEDQASVSTS
ncbi:stomatal closure actin-binding-like protein [Rhynchospora pubera]|uniref:Stomatal closure actin-binding-like protein n=1 Tax=Rhynchospora pubera TaxID=906938 RepID=A0AAV8C634_9POAL|nr:stomatal closure actin-binding-like protein [Rhynchospora pubera]